MIGLGPALRTVFCKAFVPSAKRRLRKDQKQEQEISPPTTGRSSVIADRVPHTPVAAVAFFSRVAGLDFACMKAAR
jgi:hypothetical protein